MLMLLQGVTNINSIKVMLNMILQKSLFANRVVSLWNICLMVLWTLISRLDIFWTITKMLCLTEKPILRGPETDVCVRCNVFFKILIMLTEMKIYGYSGFAYPSTFIVYCLLSIQYWLMACEFVGHPWLIPTACHGAHGNLLDLLITQITSTQPLTLELPRGGGWLPPRLCFLNAIFFSCLFFRNASVHLWTTHFHIFWCINFKNILLPGESVLTKVKCLGGVVTTP